MIVVSRISCSSVVIQLSFIYLFDYYYYYYYYYYFNPR